MIRTEVCCELSAMLRPKTYPFAVKFYEALNERPEGTMRPRHPNRVPADAGLHADSMEC